MSQGPKCQCTNPLDPYWDCPIHGKEIQQQREALQKALRKSPIVVLPSDDPVNHPPHYGGEDNPYEAIKVIEAWELDFCLGNTVKHISRAGKKGSAKEDLQKARWYLERAIWSGNYD